jgi:hypothetical protein
MEIMDDNPYKSPECEPDIPKPPPKPPNPYLVAGANGFMAFGGFAMSQAVIVQTYWVLSEPATVYSLAEKRLMLAICALIASPVGVLIAWWTLREPKSKWVFAVALFLGVIWVVLALIGISFFGLE